MSRHLLPKNKRTLNVATTGQWVNFSDEFSKFQNAIELPPHSRINVTSIPSPWARMLLFRDAILSNGHKLHLEVMSDILDVIQIIYYEKMLDFKLECKEVHLIENNPETPFHDILFKLYPIPEDESKSDYTITLVLAKRGNDTFVLAGTSPYTLFFTPLNLQLTGKVKGYFKEKPVTLAERPIDFQRWFKQVFIPRLTSQGKYPNLVDALGFPDGICAGCDQNDPEANATNRSELFHNVDLADLFDRASSFRISSPNLLNTIIGVQQPPLVIDTSVNLTGRVSYNNKTFARNWSAQELRGMDREVLPADDVRYPWVLPLCDFLQPCIMRYRYKLNDEFLIMGQGSDELKYLPPLTERYFEYFTPKEADEYLSIIDDGPNNVKVLLKIPLKGGNSITVEKRYYGSWGDNRTEDGIIEFDNKDSSTPLPHLIFWPKLNPANWRQPYYCLIYGERYDNRNAEVFSLDFVDGNNNSIDTKYSRKAGLYEIAKLETLPSYVEIRHAESGTKGFLMLDHDKFSKLDVNIENATVGIDFGTSHTNIAINHDGQTKVLQYKSGFSKKNLNMQDFIATHEFSDDQVEQSIPVLIKDGLNQYLYPNRLGGHDSEEEVSFPIPTMVIKEENVQSPEALLHYSVNFSKSRYVPYFMAAKTADKSIQEMTGLKWDHDIHSQAASEEYLRIMMTMLRSELIKRHVDPDKANYYWAYPRSFSRVDEGRYDTMWNNVLQGLNLGKTDESKAALMYFDHIQEVSAQTPGMVIIADIGGGSSDISVWRSGRIHLLASSLWAGRDLVGYKDASGIYSLLYDTFTTQFKELAEKLGGFSDYQTHFNYMLYSLSAKELNNYTQSDRFYKVKFLIIYFFSALFYEIGMQSRRFVTDDLKSLNVCLAGNGSRFAGWGGINGGISSLDAGIYKEILKRSMNLDPTVDLKLITSQKKKCEVAIGLCEGRRDLMAQPAESKPVIAESLRFHDQVLSGDVSIEQYDSTWGEQTVSVNLDKNNSEIVRFHDIFFDVLKNSDIYKRNLRNEAALSSLESLKEHMIGDWDNLVGQIRTTARDNYEHLSSISNSFFMLGMKAIIKRLHKYLSQER